MGKGASKFNKKSSKPVYSHNVLLLGLSGSGKTAIQRRLYSGEEAAYSPTEGFNLLAYGRGYKSYNVWDLGGSRIERMGWEFFYSVTDGIIYVIDSQDKDNLLEDKRQIESILSSTKLHQVPLVILANKQDKLGAVSEVEMKRILDLNDISDRLYGVFGTSTSDESSLQISLSVLINEMDSRKHRDKLNDFQI